MKFRQSFLVLLTSACINVLGGCATPTAMVADIEVDQLCATDAGVFIYEYVRLPANRFVERWKGGPLVIKQRRGKKRFGPEFDYEGTTTVLSQKNGVTVVREHAEIRRSSDGKLLGEMRGYYRDGGGLLNPAANPSHRCGQLAQDAPYEAALIETIFIPE